jgi:hypothetical protein
METATTLAVVIFALNLLFSMVFVRVLRGDQG